MTATAEPKTDEPKTDKPSWWEGIAVYLKPRVLIVLFLGFSAGLPLALSSSTLLIWMSEVGVDLRTIGLFALVGTPYTIKFLWAPMVDALDVPVLSRLLGRRRGWLVFSQLLLMTAIVLLGLCDPLRSALLVAIGALLVATASATQDIVIDAFRVDSLDESEQAAGMASYVAAYRIGMLVSTAGALFMVSGFEAFGLSRHGAWAAGYAVMGALVLIGIATSLLATEPEKSKAVGPDSIAHLPDPATLGIRPSWLQDALQRAWPWLTKTKVGAAAVGAFLDFLMRDMAFIALGFVVLFKFTDALAGGMTGPFVIQLGFSRNEYATIIKGVGLAATLIGGFAGGFVARAYPLATSLWIGGFLQAIANVTFSWQAVVGYDIAWLTFAIVMENFTSAIGTVIFVAYLSALCQNPLHTATQYALLTALAAVGRIYLSAGAGYIVTATGWFWFFIICALAGLPSLVLLWWLQVRGHFDTLVPRKN
jgi:PAT family beta-lactamase induction signal transducer AmpG